jgi:hypothetical protein
MDNMLEIFEMKISFGTSKGAQRLLISQLERKLRRISSMRASSSSPSSTPSFFLP